MNNIYREINRLDIDMIFANNIEQAAGCEILPLITKDSIIYLAKNDDQALYKKYCTRFPNIIDHFIYFGYYKSENILSNYSHIYLAEEGDSRLMVNAFCSGLAQCPDEKYIYTYINKEYNAQFKNELFFKLLMYNRREILLDSQIYEKFPIYIDYLMMSIIYSYIIPNNVINHDEYINFLLKYVSPDMILNEIIILLCDNLNEHLRNNKVNINVLFINLLMKIPESIENYKNILTNNKLNYLIDLINEKIC